MNQQRKITVAINNDKVDGINTVIIDFKTVIWKQNTIRLVLFLRIALGLLKNRRKNAAPLRRCIYGT